MITFLRSEQEIKDAIKGGDTVYWRSLHSKVERTVGGNYNVTSSVDGEKYLSVYFSQVIKRYGMSGFYTQEGEAE